MYTSNMVGHKTGPLVYEQVEIPWRIPRGGQFLKSFSIGMPKIPSNYLNPVFSLYKTRENAEKRTHEGGTGFIVSLPTVVPDQSFTYFVTNWHVAVKAGAPIGRIETHSGEPEIFEFDCADWHFSPKFDIAVVPVVLNPKVHDVAAIPLHSFLTEAYKKQHEIGIGEDVFMVGRFIQYQGMDRDVPSLRFGNISMDPAPIVQENETTAESYCIDIRSKVGYSGSPVFVYRTPGYDLGDLRENEEGIRVLRGGTSLLAFLGIHWGQFPERWEVTIQGDLKEQHAESNGRVLVTGRRYVEGLSGMTCVLPAWCIEEVLNMPELQRKRDQEDAEIRKNRGDIPIAEASTSEGVSSAQGDALLSRMLRAPPKSRD